MENLIRRKKILFVITQSEFGGAQHYVWEIARSLNPAVYDVVVAAGPEGDNELGLLVQLQKIGVQTRHLKHLKRAINPLFDFLAFRELKNLVKNEKPDILFLNSTKTGILGSFAAKNFKFQVLPKDNPRFPAEQAGFKIIYRIGGWVFNEDIANWKKKLYLFLEKFTAKWKDLIIVNSEADRELAIKLEVIKPKKIVTIHNGLDWQNIKFLERDEARFSLRTIIPSSVAKNQTADWWISRKIIGTIANLYETKGIRYFIEAAAMIRKTFPEALFFVIGEGRQRAELETLVLKNRLRDNFFILGSVPSARLYLKAFDVFVLPSVKEGMPWAILEAMAAEVPVVATIVGGIPEVISVTEPRSGILVPPKDPLALARSMVYLIKNPEEAQRITRRAKEILQNRFSSAEMIQKTEATLK